MKEKIESPSSRDFIGAKIQTRRVIPFFSSVEISKDVKEKR